MTGAAASTGADPAASCLFCRIVRGEVPAKRAYEDEVVGHFTETATLLNRLTEQYRDVHNHLARGADTLCQGRGPVSLGQLGRSHDESEIPAYLADIRPPLDYAPKTSPEEKGMLNEEFGIDRRTAGARAETPGARAPADIDQV